MIIQIIDCARIDCKRAESRDTLRYLEGIWQNSSATANGNINHVGKMTARGDKIPATVRNLLNLYN